MHDIFIEAHHAEDHLSYVLGLSVLCSCGKILLEDEGSDPQISLDEINEVRWAHYDSVPHEIPECQICGEE